MAQPDYNAPFNPTLNPWTLLRQGAAGAVTMPSNFLLGGASILGSEAAGRAREGIEDGVNYTLGVQQPYWRADPTAFAAREVGAAAIGAPARVATWVGKGIETIANPAVRFGARWLERFTPVTMPYTPRNVLINGAAGSVISGGIQELEAADERAQPVEVDLSAPLPQQAAGPIEVDLGQQPQSSGPVEVDLGAEPVADQPAQRVPTTARTILNYLGPALLAGGAVGAGVLARNAMRRGAEHDAAVTPDSFTRPGLQANEGVAELPLTGQVDQAVASDLRATFDLVQAAEDAGQMTRAVAQDTRGRLQTGLQESAKNDMVLEIERTGYHPVTGSQRTPVNETLFRAAQLEPQQLQLAKDHLVAMTELDNRATNLRTGNMVTINDQRVPARPTLWKYDDDALKARADAALLDPTVAAVVRDVRDGYRQLLIDMEASGLKSMDDITRMYGNNPNYSHTLYSEDRVTRDRSGKFVLTTGRTENNPLTARTYGHKAGAEYAQDPFVAYAEANRKINALIFENDARASLAKAIEPYINYMQQNHPDVPRLVRGFKDRLQDKTPSGWVPVQFSVGGKVRAMEAAPPVAEFVQSYPRATVPFLSASARFFRQWVTGPAGAVVGHVQALASPVIAAHAISNLRPKGTTAGIFDNAIFKWTGGKGGLREYTMLPDPTFAVQTAVQGVKNIGAELARASASALRRSEIKHGRLAAILGPAKTQDLINRMQHAYDVSQVASDRRHGSAGIGLSRDPEATRDMAVQNMTNVPEYNAVSPRRTAKPGLDEFQAIAEQYGARIAAPALVRTWRLFGTMLDIVSGAAQSAYNKQNAGRAGTVKGLHGVSRRLAGDPAETGSSQIAQSAYSMMPYSNITVQSAMSYARAIANDPSRIITLAAGLGMAQAVQFVSAMLADEQERAEGGSPRHVQHLIDMNSKGQGARISLHLPGRAPENSMSWPMDLTTAPAMALMNAAWLYGINATTGDRFWADDNKPMREYLSEFMFDRTMNGLQQGLATSFLQFTPPPLMVLAGRLGGNVNVRDALNLTNSRVSIPRDAGAPGYTQTQFWNDPISETVDATLDAMFGSGGEAIAEIYRTIVYAGRAGIENVIPAAVEQRVLNSANILRQAPPQLQPTTQMVQRDAVGDMLAAKEQGLQRVTQGIADLRRPGTIGSGNAIALPPDGADGRPAPHPTMTNVLARAQQLNTLPAVVGLRAERSKLQDALIALQSSPATRAQPAQTRVEYNRIVSQIRAHNRQLYLITSNFERQLSREEHRQVRFETLDPTKGIDQFARTANR